MLLGFQVSIFLCFNSFYRISQGVWEVFGWSVEVRRGLKSHQKSEPAVSPLVGNLIWLVPAPSGAL